MGVFSLFRSSHIAYVSMQCFNDTLTLYLEIFGYPFYGCFIMFRFFPMGFIQRCRDPLLCSVFCKEFTICYG